jgi:putative Mn2+ efflux pump MntP
MNFIMLLLIAGSLAMDAFAVSVTSAISQNRLTLPQALTISGLFGLFQGIMPLIGYFLGSSFAVYIQAFDHFVIFGILVLVGGKMILEAQKAKKEEKRLPCFSLKIYLVLAVATSIDALSVGLSFAFIDCSIAVAALVIAVVTFVICLAGVFIGKKFGDVFKNKAEVAGGIILVLIGAKILLEHLNILP